jgi:hypothetical protein
LESPIVAEEPRRFVHHGDAIAWLSDGGVPAGSSVITSLPDVSEVPELELAEWSRWFEDAALLVMRRTRDNGVAIFFQSDIKRDGQWIDKGQMIARAAERAEMAQLFHKIVCRKPKGTVTHGRASYSHLLGFARTIRPSLRHATADVLDAGFMPGPKSMGVNACVEACRFVLRETSTRTIVDPFCGLGTVLAVANALGLDAIGVDRSARMCRRARALRVALGAQ